MVQGDFSEKSKISSSNFLIKILQVPNQKEIKVPPPQPTKACTLISKNNYYIESSGEIKKKKKKINQQSTVQLLGKQKSTQSKMQKEINCKEETLGKTKIVHCIL